MNELLDSVQEWDGLSPERVSMKIADGVNKLKYDRFKQYSTKLNQLYILVEWSIYYYAS